MRNLFLPFRTQKQMSGHSLSGPEAMPCVPCGTCTAWLISATNKGGTGMAGFSRRLTSAAHAGTHSPPQVARGQEKTGTRLHKLAAFTHRNWIVLFLLPLTPTVQPFFVVPSPKMTGLTSTSCNSADGRTSPQQPATATATTTRSHSSDSSPQTSRRTPDASKYVESTTSSGSGSVCREQHNRTRYKHRTDLG